MGKTGTQSKSILPAFLDKEKLHHVQKGGRDEEERVDMKEMGNGEKRDTE